MYTYMYTLFCIGNIENSKDLASPSLFESFQQLYQIGCIAVQVFLIGLLLLHCRFDLHLSLFHTQAISVQ